MDALSLQYAKLVDVADNQARVDVGWTWPDGRPFENQTDEGDARLVRDLLAYGRDAGRAEAQAEDEDVTEAHGDPTEASENRRQGLREAARELALAEVALEDLLSAVAEEVGHHERCQSEDEDPSELQTAWYAYNKATERNTKREGEGS